MRLIDADALKAQIQREIDMYFDEDGGGIHTAMEARDEIDYAPTVDAVPVRHGKWIDEGQYADFLPHHAWRCSECGEHVIEIDTPWGRYCSNCGAKMDGKKNEKA